LITARGLFSVPLIGGTLWGAEQVRMIESASEAVKDLIPVDLGVVSLTGELRDARNATYCGELYD
jgi:hypothetical protein